MDFNNFIRSAVKMISNNNFDTKNNYKVERKVVNFTHRHIIRPFYKIWDHKVTLKDHDITVRIFSPKLEGKFPVLVFFHGGGWVTGSIDSYDRVCTNMAEITNHIVVSVDYRLAPEFKFPAGLEDCYSVTREIFLNPGLLDTASDKITLIGDSAGANLAAAVSLMARDRGEFLPKRQILIYPATNNDHTEKSTFQSVQDNGADYLLTSKRICDFMDLYQSKPEDRQNPYFAPLISEDLSNQPKTLIITAEYDPLRDEGEAYGFKLREWGNEVEIYRIRDALHGFFSLTPNFSQVKKSYKLIKNFLREVTQD